MSRRDSRASIGARHTDALVEFENLKKKFLLANKHITKLNSTLSVRIEELNAEISGLHAENLRLRASEISLAAQLKREREKSRKVMADTELATVNLTKHLAYLRQSLNIRSEPTPPPSPISPRANKQPSQHASICIAGLRISKPPNVPGIHEEDEHCPSSSDVDKPSSGKRKSRGKSRLSASKLPLPPRTISPPTTTSSATTPPLRPIALSGASASTKHRSSRRQSGLLSIDTESLAVPRPASPAFGSPIRLEAGRAEEEEEIAVISGNLEVEIEPELEPELQDYEPPPPPQKKEKRKSKTREREAEGEKDHHAIEVVRSSKEKKWSKDGESNLLPEGTKGKLRDVTNSRAVLQPINRNTVRDQEEELLVSTRTFLVQPTTLQPPPVQPPPLSEFEPTPGPGARERRARKSVNYAEPKLNTKMRKPDPPPGAEPPRTKKRSSAAAVMMTYHNAPEEPVVVDSDMGARSSGEFLPRDAQGNIINPALYPLPPSRPQSAMYSSPIPPSRTSGTSSSSSSSATTTVKRKKSKPIVESEGEDSDGTQADGEYIPGGRLSGWVNVEGRRKPGERPKKSGIIMLGDTKREFVDERRHSMAI